MTVFSINIGRKHRATPIDIISIINRALKSNDIEIGKIELNRYQTFFEIDKDFADKLKSNIKKIDFRGNEIILDAQWILTKYHREKERIEKKQSQKVALEKKEKKGKRKNLDLSKKKPPSL